MENDSHGGVWKYQATAGGLMKTITQSRGSSGGFQDKVQSVEGPTGAATHDEKQRAARAEHNENGLKLVCAN